MKLLLILALQTAMQFAAAQSPQGRKLEIIVAEKSVQTTQAPKLYPGFSRSCENPVDCQFENGVVKNTVHLNCEDDVCVCERFRYIADAPAWNLKWSGNECAIAMTGPCGESKGLRIVCQEGLQCMEGRCRDPNQIHTTPVNNSCYETIDCEEGLICRVTSFYYTVLRTCVKPDTPALAGFEDM